MWSWMSWRICLGSTEGVGREGMKQKENKNEKGKEKENG